MREEGAAGVLVRPLRRLFACVPVLLQFMFYGATSFNQALSWNTESVTNMKVRGCGRVYARPLRRAPAFDPYSYRILLQHMCQCKHDHNVTPSRISPCTCPLCIG